MPPPRRHHEASGQSTASAAAAAAAKTAGTSRRQGPSAQANVADGVASLEETPWRQPGCSTMVWASFFLKSTPVLPF